MTKRQLILAKIKTLIEAIVDDDGNKIFRYVEVSRIPPTTLDTVAFPACFIYSDRETRLEDEHAVIGTETWEWFIMLEIWAYDRDMENLLNYIHTAMYSDYKFDNYAEWSDRIGIDFFVIDPTQRLEAMSIPYRIIYRHKLGDMTT